MPVVNLFNEVVAVLSAVTPPPECGGNAMPPHCAAWVGETFNFAGTIRIAASVTLTRRPSGSSASVSTTSITFDVPGRYVVDVVVNGCPGARHCVDVFPVAAKEWPLLKYAADGTTPRTTYEIRRLLNALSACVGDTNYTALTNLESGAPTAGCLPQMVAAAGAGTTLGAIGF
jgi:hypothetical protein